MQQPNNPKRNISYDHAQYNALTDPHAEYYFASKATKKRLRQLQRSLVKEKGSSNKQLLLLVKEKIKFALPKLKLKLPLLENRPQGEVLKNLDHRKFSDQVLVSATHRTELKSAMGDQKLQMKNTQQVIRKKHKKNKHEQNSVRVKQNKVSHEQFLSFIAKKRNIITQPEHATSVTHNHA